MVYYGSRYMKLRLYELEVNSVNIDASIYDVL